MSKSVVYNADCLEAMCEMPDKAFDLCFTDPPYNVGLIYGEYADTRTDYREWCGLWFAEAIRVAEVVLFTPGMVNMLDWMAFRRPDAVMCWFKPNQCSASVLRGFNVWEPIFVYGKSPYQIPQDGILESIAMQPDAAFHPCPKSLRTWQKLLGWFARPGDRVIDPFLGSGTGRIAAHNLGIEFVGIEIDAAYFEAQEQRFADHAAQPKLFEATEIAYEQAALTF